MAQDSCRIQGYNLKHHQTKHAKFGSEMYQEECKKKAAVATDYFYKAIDTSG